MIKKLLKYYDAMSGEVIREIAELHFTRGIPTDTLMRLADTPERKIHIAAVALYSIEKKRLLGILEEEDPEVRNSILRCHKKIARYLKEK